MAGFKGITETEAADIRLLHNQPLSRVPSHNSYNLKQCKDLLGKVENLCDSAVEYDERQGNSLPVMLSRYLARSDDACPTEAALQCCTLMSEKPALSQLLCSRPV